MRICDLCGVNTDTNSQLYEAEEFFKAVKKGVRPPHKIWEKSDAKRAGASKQDWEIGWFNMAKKEKTAWLLCKSCAEGVELTLTLAEKRKCFIATAAFESDLAPEIHWLTAFRDQVLCRSFYGKTFIRLYLAISPSIAITVAKTERRKAVVRLCLRPIVQLCKRSLSN